MPPVVFRGKFMLLRICENNNFATVVALSAVKCLQVFQPLHLSVHQAMDFQSLQYGILTMVSDMTAQKHFTLVIVIM